METQAQTTSSTPRRKPWNKGKLIGQKHQREKGDGHETGDARCGGAALCLALTDYWGAANSQQSIAPEAIRPAICDEFDVDGRASGLCTT
jgi:hypothetical protein